MEVRIEKNDSVCTVFIGGMLDTLNAKNFQEQIQPALEVADKTIVINCTDLEYVSSSGLRQLLLIRKASANKGGKVIVEGLNEEILQIFKVTGFDELFELR